MDRPTLFLSFTIYDFADLRSALKDYFELGGCVLAAKFTGALAALGLRRLVWRSLLPTSRCCVILAVTPLHLGTDHNEWFGAVEMAARLEPADSLVELVHAVAERRLQSRWDRVLTVDALIDRTARDAVTRELLRKSLQTPLLSSAFCATASILAAAGALDSDGWSLCAEKLVAERSSQDIPVAVLDIVTDEVRPLSHVLANLFQASSGL